MKADPNLGSTSAWEPDKDLFERALTEMAAAMKEIPQSRDKLKGN
jgi:hypothetical protein